MKKAIFYGTLLTLLSSTSIQAEEQPTAAAPPASTQATPAASTPPSTTPTTTPTTPEQALPAPTTSQVPPATAQPAAQQPLDCNYKIDPNTKTIEDSVILNWSQKAATQAFSFDPATIDAQMQKLQNCFTEQGWTGFNSALQKSGNIDTIKIQHLTVSNQLDGEAKLIETKDNHWKVTLPLQVVYQNDKEKVTQLLNIDLTVGRKDNGELGIMQIIATPRPISVATPPANNNATSTPAQQANTATENHEETKPAVAPTATPQEAPATNPAH